MSCTINWGVVSCGKISHDFVTAVRSLAPSEGHKIVAVAARNVDSAKSFAELHNIARAYGSYRELSRDKDVDVVYIGTINNLHMELSELMLTNGKHVLVEKPLCLNLKQVERLTSLAKEKQRFLMEAIWSRFLPSYQYLKEQLNAKTIGDVHTVNVTFGIEISGVDRVAKKEMGGGGMLDIGVYCLNAITFALGGDKPLKIAAVGHLNQDGVDESVSGSLSYSNGRLGSFIISTKQNLPCELEIFGTKGKLKLPFPMWCTDTVISDDKTSTFEYPSTVLPCNYTNSSGLRYQAIEVAQCIRQGSIESSTMSHSDSELLASISDEIRRQIGVVYDQD